MDPLNRYVNIVNVQPSQADDELVRMRHTCRREQLSLRLEYKNDLERERRTLESDQQRSKQLEFRLGFVIREMKALEHETSAESSASNY